MSEPNSIREGETGGIPDNAPKTENKPRALPGQPGNVKIGKGVFQVELPKETVDNVKESAAAIALHACKAAFEKWKDKHPNATHTPIFYGKCSKDAPPAPVVEDHRPPAPKGQQH